MEASRSSAAQVRLSPRTFLMRRDLMRREVYGYRIPDASRRRCVDRRISIRRSAVPLSNVVCRNYEVSEQGATVRHLTE